jgi:hypothetical protein
VTTGPRRGSLPVSLAVATLVAAVIGGLSLYFLLTDSCLDNGGRVVSGGFGCETAAGRADFILSPSRFLLLSLGFASVAWIATFRVAHRWTRRGAG